jgi:hypothetical protein
MPEGVHMSQTEILTTALYGRRDNPHDQEFFCAVQHPREADRFVLCRIYDISTGWNGGSIRLLDSNFGKVSNEGKRYHTFTDTISSIDDILLNDPPPGAMHYASVEREAALGFIETARALPY